MVATNECSIYSPWDYTRSLRLVRGCGFLRGFWSSFSELSKQAAVASLHDQRFHTGDVRSRPELVQNLPGFCFPAAVEVIENDGQNLVDGRDLIREQPVAIIGLAKFFEFETRELAARLFDFLVVSLGEARAHVYEIIAFHLENELWNDGIRVRDEEVIENAVI